MRETPRHLSLPAASRPARGPSITVLLLKRFEANTLKGFVDLHIPHWRLKLFDCTVHESHGKRWVALPSRAQISTEREFVRDPKTGRIAYTPSVAFDNAEILRG